MGKIIRIGTRESQLALWQANLTSELLRQNGFDNELVLIKSDGDTDLKTPLYEIGVQGIFTRALDIALLEGSIDIAVHSMKDVPTVLPKGIVQASVLKRASYKDLMVPRTDTQFYNSGKSSVIATSSIRRRAQWLNRFSGDEIVNLRGNVNTRLKKLSESDWNGAIFAAAGLERIGLRPDNAFELDWMLPAPAQGAILVVCREEDTYSFEACRKFHHEDTAICVNLERDFLKALLGGCTTPISALAEVKNEMINFTGNILSADGKQKLEVIKTISKNDVGDLGNSAGNELLIAGGKEILDSFKNGK